MNYQINIALNGKHLFGTHERSITSIADLVNVFKHLDSKFSKQDGFDLSLSYHPEISYGCGRQAFKDAIDKNDKTALYALFQSK